MSSAQVEVSVSGDLTAAVRAVYRLASTEQPTFQYLSDPCSDVGQVSIAAGAPLGFTTTPAGPWVQLLLDAGGRAPSQRQQGEEARSSSGQGGIGMHASRGPAVSHQSPAEYSVTYQVSLSGNPTNVPLVIPSVSLAPGGRRDTAGVSLQVVFDGEGAGGSVVLPQMSQHVDRVRWSSRMVALPSFVRVDLGAGADVRACSAAVPSGPTGGLEWWLLSLALSMVGWVVFYMWWARSRGEA